MVLYILTGYRVLGIVYLDQLTDAHHTHTYIITILHSDLITILQRFKKNCIFTLVEGRGTEHSEFAVTSFMDVPRDAFSETLLMSR